MAGTQFNSRSKLFQTQLFTEYNLLKCFKCVPNSKRLLNKYWLIASGVTMNRILAKIFIKTYNEINPLFVISVFGNDSWNIGKSLLPVLLGTPKRMKKRKEIKLTQTQKYIFTLITTTIMLIDKVLKIFPFTFEMYRHIRQYWTVSMSD